VAGAVAGAVEDEEAPALEDAVDDGVGEVAVVQRVAPVGGRGHVGGEDHRPLSGVAVVDDVDEDAGGVAAVREVADLVDHEEVRGGVRGQGLAPAAGAAGGGEVVDEGRSRDDAGGEPSLDGLVGDRDGEVRLAPPGLAEPDETPALGDQFQSEVCAQQREPRVSQEGEVDVADRPDEGEPGVPGATLETGVAAVSARRVARSVRWDQPSGSARATSELAPSASTARTASPTRASAWSVFGSVHSRSSRLCQASPPSGTWANMWWPRAMGVSCCASPSQPTRRISPTSSEKHLSNWS
jgi:hypothetical protein